MDELVLVLRAEAVLPVGHNPRQQPGLGTLQHPLELWPKFGPVPLEAVVLEAELRGDGQPVLGQPALHILPLALRVLLVAADTNVPAPIPGQPVADVHCTLSMMLFVLPR